jgi:hypothetical protein
VIHPAGGAQIPVPIRDNQELTERSADSIDEKLKNFIGRHGGKLGVPAEAWFDFPTCWGKRQRRRTRLAAGESRAIAENILKGSAGILPLAIVYRVGLL